MVGRFFGSIGDTFSGFGLMHYVVFGTLILGIILMFILHRAAASRVMVSLMCIYGGIISYLSYMALPPGFNVPHWITLGLALIMIAGLLVGMISGKPKALSKILVAIGVAGGFIYMFFF